jgi:hypothetical protein
MLVSFVSFVSFAIPASLLRVPFDKFISVNLDFVTAFNEPWWWVLLAFEPFVNCRVAVVRVLHDFAYAPNDRQLFYSHVSLKSSFL